MAIRTDLPERRSRSDHTDGESSFLEGTCFVRRRTVITKSDLEVLNEYMSGANASRTRSASAIARSLKEGRSHQVMPETGRVLSVYLDVDQSKAANLNRKFELAFESKVK